MQRFKRVILFIPLLLSAIPVLFLAARNPIESEIPHVLSALGVVLLGTLLVIFLLRLFVKDELKVAAITSVVVIAFFSFGHIVEMLASTTIGGIYLGRLRYLYLFYFLGTITCALAIFTLIRSRRNLEGPMQYVGLVALFLVMVNAASYGFSNFGISSAAVETKQVGNSEVPEGLRGNLPDIYYIIPDGYVRGDALKLLYSFQNDEFLNFLEHRGFYIGSESRSNYVHTILSLSSSMNMDYHSEEDDLPITALFDYAIVPKIAKEFGYKFIQFDSGWRYTRRSPQADVIISKYSGSSGGLMPLLLNDYTEGLLRTTLASTFGFEKYFVRFRAQLFEDDFQSLKKIANDPNPTFTFYHILQPHPPYIFDREGNLLSKTEHNPQTKFDWAITDLYVDQLVYVNKNLEDAVEFILLNSDTEPIIIIQGDHGTAATSEKYTFGPDEPEIFKFERPAILNALHLPESCSEGLYPSISPVNSFRFVFDNCFGTDFGLLEDRTFLSESLTPPYEFSEVTRVALPDS